MKNSQSFSATERRPKVAHGETVGLIVQTNKAPERGERNVCAPIFCRPSRGLKIFRNVQPTVSPWASFCRASGALITAILFFAVGATAQTTNTLSDAEIQGRALAQKILEQWPTQNSTHNVILKIHAANGNSTNLPVQYKTIVGETNWSNFYDFQINGATWRLGIEHNGTNYTQYEMLTWDSKGSNSLEMSVPINDWQMFPYGGSDFCLGDLGLEFFHWPAQKVLKKEVHRSRGCTVLESTNPNPGTNGYSRVVSWIDNESLGIVEAYAYDANGKKLKDFYPKDFKKVDGQWQVQTLVMENVQTGSRSRLEFDLKK